MTASTAARPPAVFLSHGAPPLVDDQTWVAQLAELGTDLPRPTAILIVSAHWEAQPLTIGATDPSVPLTYDFYGFPERYYRTRYAPPDASALAARVAAMIPDSEPVHHDPDRRLDHGAYVPLTVMYPDADIPVLQLSLPTLDPNRLFDIGRRLAPLRDEGVLIVGSGFTTHNLRLAVWGDTAGAAPGWSQEFDAWAAEAMAEGDIEALLRFASSAPHASVAHPRTEHWAPVYVALGAADATAGGMSTQSVIDGFWYGLSKRSWQFS